MSETRRTFRDYLAPHPPHPAPVSIETTTPIAHALWNRSHGYSNRRPSGAFGCELARQMMAHRLPSQSALARKAGYHHSLINRLVTGERQPTREQVRTIVRALPANAEEETRLWQAAGFPLEVPIDPLLARVRDALTDPAVSHERKDQIRAALVLIADAVGKGSRV